MATRNDIHDPMGRGPTAASLASLRADARPEELAKQLAPMLESMLTERPARSDLIALLRAHEARHGVTEVHHRASEAARGQLRLFHPYPHDVGIVAASLSPSGRWLATSSPMPPREDWDAAWARGGVVAIWDVQSGRCVNVLDRVSGGAGALSWHESEAYLGVSLGAHGVGRYDPFEAPGKTLISSISEGELPGCHGFDGGAPSWCWIPGSFDIVLATYIVTLGEERSVVRKRIEDDVCNFRHCVSAYDGIITDGNFTLRAGDFERVEKRPLNPDLIVANDHVILRGLTGRETRLEVEPLSRYGARFPAVTYSPDRSEVAVLTRSGLVVRFGADGDRRGEVELPWADGIRLGVDGVLVALSAERVAFVGGDGRTFRDCSVVSDLEPHPLGANASAREDAFRYDPAFATGSSWVVALESGEVAAPAEAHSRLDELLSYALDRSHAWPWRWVAPDRHRLSTSLADLPLPAAVAKGLKKAAAPNKAPRKKVAGLELGPATVEDVLDQLGARVPELEALHEQERQAAHLRLGLTEATAGRSARAAALLERALQPSDYPRGNSAITVAFAADLLARSGSSEKAAVEHLTTLCSEIPNSEHATPSSRAAVLAHCARARHRLGDFALASALIDEAVALAPGWTAEPSPYAAAPSQLDEAALVAKLLVADQRPDEAMRIVRNLGGCSGMASLCTELAERGDHLVLDALATLRDPATAHERAAQALLRAGHYELFDELMPTIPELSYMKHPLAIARRVYPAITARDRATSEALIEELSKRLELVRENTPAWQAEACLSSAASGVVQILDAGMDELARALAVPLRATLEHALAARLAWLDGWTAIAALSRVGADVSPWLDRTLTVNQRLQTLRYVLPFAGDHRASVLALSDHLGESVPKSDAGLASYAAAALAAVGEEARAEALFSVAVSSADKDHSQLGTIAEQRLAVGEVQAAWACLQLIPKARRPDCTDDFLRSAAIRGRADVVAAVLAQLPSQQLPAAIWSIGNLVGVPFDAS